MLNIAGPPLLVFRWLGGARRGRRSRRGRGDEPLSRSETGGWFRFVDVSGETGS